MPHTTNDRPAALPPLEVRRLTLVPVRLSDSGETVPLTVAWDPRLDLLRGLSAARPGADPEEAFAAHVEDVMLGRDRLVLYVNDAGLLPPWVWATADACGHTIAEMDCGPSEHEAEFVDILEMAPDGNGHRDLDNLRGTLTAVRDAVTAALLATYLPDAKFERMFDTDAGVGYVDGHEDQAEADQAGQTAALNPVGRVQGSDETPGA